MKTCPFEEFHRLHALLQASVVRSVPEDWRPRASRVRDALDIGRTSRVQRTPVSFKLVSQARHCR